MEYARFATTLMFLSFTIVSFKSERCCITTLLPQLNLNWAQNLVYFVNLINEKYSLKPCSSLKTRNTIITNNTRQFIVPQGNYRFSNTFNVIISPWSSSENYNTRIKLFMDTLSPTRSIFFFTTILNHTDTSLTTTSIDNFTWNPSSLIFYPVLTAVLSINMKSQCDLNLTVITYLCNGYCKHQPRQNSDTFSLAKFNQIRDSLYKNGNGKIIPSLVVDVFRYTDHKPSSKSDTCLNFVKSLNSTCRSDIMISLVFGSVYNATMFLIKQTPDQLLRYQVTEHYSTMEHISNWVSFGDSNVPFSTLNQLQFEVFDSNALFYCKRRKQKPRVTLGNTVRLFIWHRPFKFGVWLSIAGILVCAAIYLRMDTTFAETIGMLRIFSSALGHERWKIKKTIFLPCSIAFLLLVYANRLLSNVTIVETKGEITSLRKLLDFGFKIVWIDKFSSESPHDFYHFDFKLYGLLDRINDTFYSVPNITRISDVVAVFSYGDQKLALSYSKSRSEMMLKYLTQKTRLTDPSFECFKVDETIRLKMYSWRVNTQNGYWFRKTLSRLVTSGIYVQWDKWSTWGHLMRSKQLDGFDVVNHIPEYIQLPNFIVILLVLSGIHVISIMLLCVEIARYRYKSSIEFRSCSGLW
ncbi:unnamed protein product [Orchesella dallaii]|uniref:Uncharacterized protein n=1 Tax=Orchesella dallaii TaxID=48710 RepID=A0ABP1R6C9_9HEXA